MRFRTVGDLIAELQQMDQTLPVLVGCHYDNDNGLKNQVSVRVATVGQVEDEYYDWADPTDPGTFQAVLVN